MSDLVFRIRSEGRKALSLIEALADALDEEGIGLVIEGETDLKELAARALRRIRELEALERGLTAMLAESEDRLRRFVRQREAVRGALARAVLDAGRGSLELPEATLSARMTKGEVVVTEPAGLPAALIQTKVTKTPDKKSIRAAIEAGGYVPGAHLGEPVPSLTVRAR